MASAELVAKAKDRGKLIKERLKELDMKPAELARKTRIEPGHLSKIIKGEIPNVGIGTIEAIAEGLRLPLDVVATGNKQSLSITFMPTAVNFVSGDIDLHTVEVGEKVFYQSYNKALQNSHLVLLRGYAEPGGSIEVDDHKGEELFYIEEGELEFIVHGEPYRIKRGDALYFKPTFKHSLSNPTKSLTKFVRISVPTDADH